MQQLYIAHEAVEVMQKCCWYTGTVASVAGSEQYSSTVHPAPGWWNAWQGAILQAGSRKQGAGTGMNGALHCSPSLTLPPEPYLG
jgi:hypothetical protein